jgi:hypothetical protein
MPHIKIYIRKGDKDKWFGIPNKAEFLHKAINNLEKQGDVKEVKHSRLETSVYCAHGYKDNCPFC